MLKLISISDLENKNIFQALKLIEKMTNFIELIITIYA